MPDTKNWLFTLEFVKNNIHLSWKISQSKITLVPQVKINYSIYYMVNVVRIRWSVIIHLLETFLKFFLEFSDLRTFDNMLLHSHFTFKSFVTNFANVLRFSVIHSEWLNITSLTLTNMLGTIWKITETTITIWTFVLFDTQVSINMRFMLILSNKWKYWNKLGNLQCCLKSVKHIVCIRTLRTNRFEQNSQV